ncbi:hypothetical protein ABEB36_007585 [Hypothenemus hampei]|uniref:Uncharacterized protein n=1 Tax=Hypothenemus hampei TaxID=57062 RepID=A0ABD1EUH6_HYPHA
MQENILKIKDGDNKSITIVHVSQIKIWKGETYADQKRVWNRDEEKADLEKENITEDKKGKTSPSIDTVPIHATESSSLRTLLRKTCLTFESFKGYEPT